MKLILGLGNPGSKYAGTRHNVGFVFLDAFVQIIDSNCVWKTDSSSHSKICPIPLKDLILAKPQDYMNNSGSAASLLANYYKISSSDIYVVHDDLDIKLGEFKIQEGKGPKDHGGIQSVENSLGKKDFWRVRIGVENRKDKKISGEDYVLMKFEEEEQSTIRATVDKAAHELVQIISK